MTTFKRLAISDVGKDIVMVRLETLCYRMKPNTKEGTLFDFSSMNEILEKANLFSSARKQNQLTGTWSGVYCLGKGTRVVVGMIKIFCILIVAVTHIFLKTY